MRKMSKKERMQIILSSMVVLTIALVAILVFSLNGSKNEPQPRLSTPTLARLEKTVTKPIGEYTISVNATHDKMGEAGFEFMYTWQIDGQDYVPDVDTDADPDNGTPVDTNVAEIDQTFDESDIGETFVITCEVIATLDGYEDSEPATFTLNLTVESNLLDPPGGDISISPNPNPNN